jgi:hypothetical protein
MQYDRSAFDGGGEDCMPSLSVRTVSAVDEAAAIGTVVLAFAADPVPRWTWPDSHQYLAGMPRLARAFGATRRHGFEALGTIQVGSSPPLVPMLRPAR